MPTRLLRDGINTSERVNALSESAELFYRKMMSLVDDFGRYEANVCVICGQLYALRRNIQPEDVAQYLSECCAGDDPLISIYVVGGKRYLKINQFGQRERTSRYPAPPQPEHEKAGGGESRAKNCGRMPPPAARASHPHSPSYTPSYTHPPAPSPPGAAESRSGEQPEIQPPLIPVPDPVPKQEELRRQFPAWWAGWSAMRGTNHEPQAARAWQRVVTEANLPDCVECTASYLDSLGDPVKGYNPENFLFEQAKQNFKARWPKRKPAATDYRAKGSEEFDRRIQREAERRRVADG